MTKASGKKQHHHEMGWKPEDHEPVEYDGPSRSELKREAIAKTDLVDDLLALSKEQLKKFTCFDDEFRDGLALLKKIPFGSGYRRQRSFLGKRIRQEGWDEQVQHILAIVTGDSKQAVAIQHRCEQWRDRLLSHGDESLTELLMLFPDADRQALRQLVRLSIQEQEQQKPPKHKRLLFKMLREMHEPATLAFRSSQPDEDEEDAS